MFNLTIIRPDGREIDQGFETEKTIVGRSEKCDLRLVDGMVSRNHCIILTEAKRFIVKDLESRNGTWVNGRKIKNRRQIKKGDIIQVGPFRLVFIPEPEEHLPLATQTLEMGQLESEPFVHKDERKKW